MLFHEGDPVPTDPTRLILWPAATPYKSGSVVKTPQSGSLKKTFLNSTRLSDIGSQITTNGLSLSNSGEIIKHKLIRLQITGTSCRAGYLLGGGGDGSSGSIDGEGHFVPHPNWIKKTNTYSLSVSGGFTSTPFRPSFFSNPPFHIADASYTDTVLGRPHVRWRLYGISRYDAETSWTTTLLSTGAIDPSTLEFTGAPSTVDWDSNDDAAEGSGVIYHYAVGFGLILDDPDKCPGDTDTLVAPLIWS